MTSNNPPVYTEQTVKDLVWSETANCWTPDMPLLRYGGPIPVFLSGSLADAERMKNISAQNDLKLYDDWTSVSYRCKTAGKYCAYRNKGSLVDEVSTPDFVFPYFHDVYIEGGLTPRQVRGKLISCSLKTISVLDGLHYNTVLYDRVKIKLDTDYGGYSHAYIYLTKKDSIFNQGTLKKSINMRSYCVEKVGDRSAYF